MTELKYKLIRVGKLPLNDGNGIKKRFFQLQALRDIPEHGVKAGDMGGYVTRKNTLSHEGSCWVGGEAQLIGYVFVDGNAYVGDKALLNAPLEVQSIYIEENAKVYGNTQIDYDLGTYRDDITIKGNAKIYGNAFLEGVMEISDEVEIYGDAEIKPGVRVLGNSKIYDNAVLNKRCRVIDTIVNGLAEIGEGDRIRNGKLDTTGINGSDGETQKFDALKERNATQKSYIEKLESELYLHAVSSVENHKEIPNGQNYENLEFFHEITANIDSYATDIVKIIKYPAMVDPSVPETLAMTVSLKKATRLSRKPESEEFAQAVSELEENFIKAEAQAFKLASTLLSDEDKKKTRKASDLFRVASNEASSEQEKKVAFIQGFKQLEGVIPVPEIAVDTFRVRIGLPELES